MANLQEVLFLIMPCDGHLVILFTGPCTSGDVLSCCTVPTVASENNELLFGQKNVLWVTSHC